MKTDPAKIVLPFISINGTSRGMLREGYCDASAAIYDAIEAMQKIEFHSRDYMQQEGGEAKWRLAKEQFQDRLARLREIREELQVIIEHVCSE